MDAARCQECGTPLDEVPIKECSTHRKALRCEPDLTDEEIVEAAEGDLLRMTMERTGDD